ncbi:MAG TPA: AraC family transcriptional regulator, partial [Flavobacteriaceae bacterium]|nr:AraC family transcriptional regulator [Flavobacteriaceae bacterium]
SGLFSTREKISIRDYQKKVKIERAKELLEYNEMNINQISANMGYQGASYFCTFFKKETGLTPLGYQKKHLKKRIGLSRL